MTILYIAIPSFLLLCMGLYFFWLYIKNEYRKYDREETQKEEILKMKGLIKDAMDYFYEHYNNDFDSSVYFNIRTKVDYIIQLLSKMEKLDQKYIFYKKLYQRLYETGYRLKVDFNNVNSIIKPTSSLIEEILSYYRNESLE